MTARGGIEPRSGLWGPESFSEKAIQELGGKGGEGSGEGGRRSKSSLKIRQGVRKVVGSEF